MILIGQYDSPFVRRVAIAMRLYDVPFEHRAWSTFREAERVAAFNPLIRVPTLVLEDGEILVDSISILDHLDELAGEERGMMPRRGPGRRAALRICVLATGLADKSVSLVYERLLHEGVSTAWVDRCRAQIEGVLASLEIDRAANATPYWHGDRIGHADIAFACAFRFLGEAHPGLVDPRSYPALAAHAAALEATEPFRAIAQPFIPPR